MNVPFNVNGYVRVRLNDRGKALLRAEWDKLMVLYPKLQEYHGPDEDSDGWSRWQLWDFMHQFGHHISLCRLSPFETTIEIVLPDDAARALLGGASLPSDKDA